MSAKRRRFSRRKKCSSGDGPTRAFRRANQPRPVTANATSPPTMAVRERPGLWPWTPARATRALPATTRAIGPLARNPRPSAAPRAGPIQAGGPGRQPADAESGAERREEAQRHVRHRDAAEAHEGRRRREDGAAGERRAPVEEQPAQPQRHGHDAESEEHRDEARRCRLRAEPPEGRRHRPVAEGGLVEERLALVPRDEPVAALDHGAGGVEKEDLGAADGQGAEPGQEERGAAGENDCPRRPARGHGCARGGAFAARTSQVRPAVAPQVPSASASPRRTAASSRTLPRP